MHFKAFAIIAGLSSSKPLSLPEFRPLGDSPLTIGRIHLNCGLRAVLAECQAEWNVYGASMKLSCRL